jgi:hypothetical protein
VRGSMAIGRDWEPENVTSRWFGDELDLSCGGGRMMLAVVSATIH